MLCTMKLVTCGTSPHIRRRAPRCKPDIPAAAAATDAEDGCACTKACELAISRAAMTMTPSLKKLTQLDMLIAADDDVMSLVYWTVF